MANTKINWTPSSSGNRNTWTWSGWVKRNGLGATQTLFGAYQNSSYNTKLQFNSVDRIHFGDLYNNSPHAEIVTEAKYRDTSGWYNIVVNYDKANSTTNDKIRMYVNGERIIAMSSGPDRPTQSSTLNSDGIAIQHGALASTTYFNGVMSHVHFCDGYSYDASKFGSVDSVTGEWKINTSPSVNYGNNGFTILKDGNTITDQTSGSNNFSLSGGAITATKDCPSNVFCTFNKLYNTNANGDLIPVLTSGNTILLGHGGSYWYQIPGTLAFTSGKFYWECKFNSGTNLDKNTPGVIDYEKCFGTGQFQDQTGSVFYKNEDGGETRLDSSTSSANYGTLTQNQILGVAVDMDAGTPTVKFYRNGSLLATVNASSLAGKFVTPAQMVYGSGQFQLNFGNGYFGTTAVSSAGTNASGNGIFEYDVPSGYTALSTKGLNL